MARCDAIINIGWYQRRCEREATRHVKWPIRYLSGKVEIIERLYCGPCAGIMKRHNREAISERLQGQ